MIFLLGLSWSSYVLLSTFQIQYEISEKAPSEDKPGAEKTDSEELTAIVPVVDGFADTSLTEKQKIDVYLELKILTFKLSPNTPPPDAV